MSLTAAPLPSPLRQGDRVAMLAPSGPTPADQLQQAQTLLHRWGLEPVVFPSATATHSHAAYLSGEDSVRADDLMRAWCDPSIAGIFCLRGGYGAIRLLDLLDPAAMSAAMSANGPTTVFGSSDITCLHEWLRERLGVASWFTPMIGTAPVLHDQVARDRLRQAVFEPAAGRVLTSEQAQVLVPGVARGVLIGGNLSLLAMTLGARTRAPIDNAGAIVLLEDISEDTYKVDGYLQALLRAGAFDGVTGIALGSWKDCAPAETIKAVCRELLAPLGVPMVWELGFGHDVGANSVPLGVAGRLLADAAGPALVIGEGT